MNTISSTQKQGKITFILKILNLIDKTSKIFGLEKATEKLVLLTVRSYQLYISPHKGFSCAYSKLHHQPSCSNYFYSSIINQDLSTARVLLQQRLIDCKQAYIVLETESGNQKRKRKRQSNEGNNCWAWSDAFFWIGDFGDCGTCDGADCEAGICDVGGCDFG